MTTPPPCRLYLITPPVVSDEDAFLAQLAQAFDGGEVACVQLRLKSADGVPAPDDVILRLAGRMLEVIRPAGSALLINDRPDLARRAGADGVHIGQSDGSVAAARALLGETASIGVTCHNSIDLAFRAGEAGADYVAFGAFFPTSTKDAPTRADPEILVQWAETTVIPSVAIGGLSPENCAPLVAAGADFLAASGAVWAAPGGAAAAVRAFHRAITQAQP